MRSYDISLTLRLSTRTDVRMASDLFGNQLNILGLAAASGG